MSLYAATPCIPGRVYFGRWGKTRRTSFIGKEGFWVVYDDQVDGIFYPRAVEDNEGKPDGFTPLIYKGGDFVAGYLKVKE